ncbi:MAG TPA: type II toxin-antitoxin system RelE/ParE family toxin [Candidatus Aquilonibacter sp.]|nr:type II toxin-antitoxin system RelE/ParE family toxin [Candidatus Aquilonibacter sp.]
MRYRVIVTPDAESDLRVTHGYLRDRARRAAGEWIRKIRSSIKTLSRYPERCSPAPESASFEEPIRQLLFGFGNRGTYRILFTVIGDAVYVLHVRHGSMLPREPRDL